MARIVTKQRSTHSARPAYRAAARAFLGVDLEQGDADSPEWVRRLMRMELSVPGAILLTIAMVCVVGHLKGWQ